MGAKIKESQSLFSLIATSILEYFTEARCRLQGVLASDQIYLQSPSESSATWLYSGSRLRSFSINNRYTWQVPFESPIVSAALRPLDLKTNRLTRCDATAIHVM